MDLAHQVEAHLPVLGGPAPIDVEQGGVAVVGEGEAVAQGTAVIEQVEIDDRASEQPDVRKLPVAKIPRHLEEPEPLVDGHEPPLEPVDRVADLIAVHGAREGGEDPLQRRLEPCGVFDGASILKNDPQDPVPRELSYEIHVVLQVVDVGQRNPHRNAAQVQRPDDLGELRAGEDLLVLERTFQIDAEPDAVVVRMGAGRLASNDGAENRPGKTEHGREVPEHAADAAPAEPALDARRSSVAGWSE